MKVLLIKPMEHPQVVDIENSLQEFYRILDCDCITATYPWEERAALVTDDNGLFTEKSFSRYIPELEQPIKGNFFICGLGEEDFAELPRTCSGNSGNASGCRRHSSACSGRWQSSRWMTERSRNKIPQSEKYPLGQKRPGGLGLTGGAYGTQEDAGLWREGTRRQIHSG